MADENFMTLLFGPFNKDISRFRFYFGEKKLIRELVSYTKKVVDTPNVNDGLNHFAKKLTAKKTFVFQSTMFCINENYFLTDRIAMNSKQSTRIPIENGGGSSNIKTDKEINLDEQKNIIFKKALEHVESFEKKANVNRPYEFKLDFVNIIGSTYNDMKSTVRCCFCDFSSENSNVKIFLHRTASGGNWRLSNLVKHFTLHHMPTDHPKEKEKLSIVALEIEPCTSNKEGSERVPSVRNNVFIEYCAAQLLAQMSIQSIKMVNTAILNKDVVEYLRIKQKVNEIKTCQIKPDGDCLFAAITHQLNQVKINSVQHNNLTAALKNQVIEHIKANVDDFEGYLRGRVDEYKSKDDINNLKEEFQIFLNVRLPLRLSWGGSETMKAVTELLKVNILVINEFGDCKLEFRYRPEYNRCVILSFRSFKLNDTLDHYDSVIEISEDALTKFANQAAESEWKYQSLISKQSDEPQLVEDSD